MVADPHWFLMSVAEYLELDRNSLEARYEFVDGTVYMLAGGTNSHSIIGVNLVSLLHAQLRGKPCLVYNSDLRVRISPSHYLYPDVSVSCDARDREPDDMVKYPSVIIEVLSPSTEAYDRGRKFSYYRTCPTLREYVLVDPQQQAIDVYRRHANNLWTFHPFGRGDEVELKSINVHFPIAAAYEDVALPDDTSDNSPA
jgi:Uma2 family endonuclease